MQEETVCAILRQSVIWEKDAQEAHKQLLGLSGIAKYYRGLRSEDEKEHFERHLRKYINIYLPDCPFEVATTNRYTVTTSEACVKARRTIRRGEVVKYLTGIQVEMTEKEEEELSSRTDFSIVLSSRRKRPSLFLGPARFANHDCDSNARLNTSGPHGIHIVAVKEILPGDEITVTYGDDYFGIDNCECLCSTCENLQRNGWHPMGPWLKDDSSDEEDEDDDEEADDAPVAAASSELDSEASSNAVLGKRKRDVEASVSAGDDHEKPKRKRGRPRKSEIGDGKDVRSQGTATTSDSQSGHPKKRQEFLDHISRPGSATCSGSARRAAGSPQFDAKDVPSEYTLERIYELLNVIADRSTGTKTSAAPASQSQAGASDERKSDLDAGSKATSSAGESNTPLSRQNLTTVGTGLLTPPYARGLSRSPEPPSTTLKGPLTPRASADPSKLRVPSIKKERSMSSLRNVVNATTSDSERDVFSIPTSPGPSDPPKRKRGRPRKYPKTDESEDTADSSVSSASQNSDSGSSASTHVSSATSIETFAAGDIANSICQMLVSDREAANDKTEADAEIKDDEEAVEVAAPIPRTTRRQAQAEAARAEQAAKAAKEAAKQKRGRRRGPLRTSPRKAPPSTSRPPVRSIETPDSSSPIQDDEPPDEGYHRGPIRKPGDYHLTAQLLATPYHRWIECRNCDEFFVQGEAYLTRIACPRCERHSKLYGYYWPKTDREGKGDVEERVKDHRTIHRFIDAEDERNERKGRKTLAAVVREREESERMASEERLVSGDEEVGARGLRRSPGGRRRRERVTM